MATTVDKILLAGTQAAYDALTPDSGKLYFCTDTRNMYKGSDLYTDGIRVVTTDPTTPAEGKIYYNSTDDVLKTYSNGAWVTLRVAMATSVTSASTDEQIATAKAVYDYVTSAIEDVTGSGSVVQSVVAGTDDATLSVTTGGAASTVTVPGVVTTPSYDATTRTITLPVSGGDDLVIALGKDIFVESGEYDSETGNIILTLNDGTTTIEIPASALVDTYTGDSTTTATVTVDNLTNVITATVTLSTDANNSLVVDATNGGLLVDLSEYAKSSEVTTAVQAVQDDVDALETRVDTVEAAITLLNGDSDTEGSVDYKIAQAQATTTTAVATAQSTADDAATAAATAQSTADDAATAVSEIEDAWGFGEF